VNRFLIIILLLMSLETLAREKDGALGLIQYPHNARPALALQGATFRIELREDAAVLLRTEKISIPLAVTWTTLPGGNVSGICHVPLDAEPGPYTLEATTPTLIDQNFRSVHVYDAFPNTYRVAHIAEASSPERLKKALVTAGESGAAFALITAPIARTGTREALQSWTAVLDQSPVPAFVSPQGANPVGNPGSNFFGSAPYAFGFGADGYLAFVAVASPSHIAAAEYRLRRLIRPARWSIGFTHRYDERVNMRSQLTLFVDDPLDVLVTDTSRGVPVTIPWGTTDAIVTVGDDVRMIEIGERAVN
jgi:hypothetical protein